MANSFEGLLNDVNVKRTDNYYLGCRECGSEIVIINNNCEYSYLRHRESTEHLEFIENFTSSGNSSDDRYRDSDYFAFIKNFNSRKEFFNDISLDDEDEIFPVLELKKDTFYSTYCNFCRLVVPNSEFKAQKRDEMEHVCTRSIVEHFHTGLHEWNLMKFKSNKHYVQRIPSTYMFECTLCEVSLETDRLVLHFKSLQHEEKRNLKEVHYMETSEALNMSGRLCHPIRSRSCRFKSLDSDASEFSIWEKKVKESADIFKISELDTIFIGIQNNAVRCLLCDITLISLKNTVAHMRGNFHKMMKKKFRVNIRCLQWCSNTEVSCIVCSGNFSLKKFLDHCEEDFHRMEYEELKKSACRDVKFDRAFVAVGEYFTDVSKYGLLCTICRVQCIGVEGLIRHFGFKHRITPEGSLDSFISD